MNDDKWLKFLDLSLKHFNDLLSTPIMQIGEVNTHQVLVDKYIAEVRSFCSDEECLEFQIKYNQEVARMNHE